MNMAFGDNGLIKQAQLAKDMAANSVIAEQEGINSLMGEFANVMAGDSEITPPDPGPTLPEGWDVDKVTAEESSDGVTVPVPKGYTASDATGERSVNDGFVIYEGTEEVNDGNVDTAKTTRNQFVWIPVPDISQIANQTKKQKFDKCCGEYNSNCVIFKKKITQLFCCVEDYDKTGIPP